MFRYLKFYIIYYIFKITESEPENYSDVSEKLKTMYTSSFKKENPEAMFGKFSVKLKIMITI